MAVHIRKSSLYESTLLRIEDHLFESTASTDAVRNFLELHAKAIEFISQNPTTPPMAPDTGDRSWPFGEGRYRLYFVPAADGTDLFIFLSDLIDNREINSRVYPDNSWPDFEED